MNRRFEINHGRDLTNDKTLMSSNDERLNADSEDGDYRAAADGAEVDD
jgi:hypothetical protein